MKKVVSLLVMGIFVAIAQTGASLACDLCAVYRSMEAKSGNSGFHIGLFEQFTHFPTLQLDGDEEDDPVGQRLDGSITQFIVGYQVNDRFGVQVNVPYLHRSFKRPEGFAVDKGTEAGVGDLSLIGHYRVYRHSTDNALFAWDVLGGVKFPTGSSDRLREELEEEEPEEGAPESGIHGHDLALGSGSYDGIVGTGFFVNWQRLFATAGLQYAIRTRGDIDYRFANDLSWYVKPGGYLWLDHRGTLGLQLAVTGEIKGKDDLDGVKAEDTGITSVFVGPEFTFTWKEWLSAELGIELPVQREDTALQLVPDYRVKAAITWRF